MNIGTTAVALALAITAIAQPADAAIITLTLEGTIASGYDQTNVFNTGQTNLAGFAYNLVFTFDEDAPGASVSGGPSWGYNAIWGGSSTIFTINGVSESLDGIYGSNITITDNTIHGDPDNDRISAYSWGNYVNSSNYKIVGFSFAPEILDIIKTSDYNQPIDYTLVGGEDLGGVPGSIYNFYFTNRNSGVTTTLAYGIFKAAGTRIRLSSSDYVAPGIPEPATWTMLIAGFGFTGAAMRRRRPAVAA